jgi:hypothetical protein
MKKIKNEPSHATKYEATGINEITEAIAQGVNRIKYLAKPPDCFIS